MLILLIFKISQGSKWKHLFYSSNKIRWNCYISAKDTNIFVQRKISSEEYNLTRKLIHPWQRILRLWQQHVLKNGDLEGALFAGSECVHLSWVLCSCNHSNPEEKWREEIPQAGSHSPFPRVRVYHHGENYPKNIFLVNGNTESLKILCLFLPLFVPSF